MSLQPETAHKFAFITHPVSMRQFKLFWPISGIVPVSLISAWRGGTFKIISIQGCSKQNKPLQGYLLVLPFLPEELVRKGEAYALKRLLQAAEIVSDLGVKMIGLGGYFASVADNNPDGIRKEIKLPVTSGRSYAAWSIIEGIYRAAKVKRVELKNSTVAVLGADTALGSLCARKISEFSARVVLNGSSANKLEPVLAAITRSGREASIEADAGKALEAADILIIACNECPVFDSVNLKPGAIVSNLSLFCRPAGSLPPRKDITFIDSGLVKVPNPDSFRLRLGLPKGIVCAPLAETMVLTLTERFVNYSSGDDIELHKAEAIADLAVRSGFEVWVPEAPVL